LYEQELEEIIKQEDQQIEIEKTKEESQENIEELSSKQGSGAETQKTEEESQENIEGISSKQGSGTETKRSLEKEAPDSVPEPTVGSLIDDYADVNAEMPSYMDPEDG
jgi:hypothetical protein